jgi:tetratricopeptide (TPR) repeat protein
VSEHAVVKTLVMEDDARNPLIVLMHGDLKVSTRELARIVGVKTIAPFALFWILAAMLTAAPRQSAHRTWPRALGIGGLVIVAAVGCFAVAATTVWLMGSMSYARGVALARANRFAEARVQLEHAARLVPWLPAPRSTAGEAALRIAGLEGDPARRAAAIKRIEMLLATPHRGSAVSADLWLVRGQVALTRARDGELQQRVAALAAFARADRLRPNDIRILTPWALTLLIDNQPAQARALAERVVRMDDEEWLAWAVIARASARLGDQPREREADAEARRRVPPENVRFLDGLGREL